MKGLANFWLAGVVTGYFPAISDWKMWKNVASQKLSSFLFTPLHDNGHNSCSSWANWKISLPKPIYYSRAICWYPQITRGHVSRAWKHISNFLNFDMKKLKKPDFFDLTVNEVFEYTILAFRKHMSLLQRNFLLCFLLNLEKCQKMLLHKNFQIFYLHPSTKMAKTPVLVEQIEKFHCLNLSTTQGLSADTLRLHVATCHVPENVSQSFSNLTWKNSKNLSSSTPS